MSDDPKTQIDLEAAMKDGRLKPHPVDAVNATTIRLVADSNEIAVVFQRPKYGVVSDPKHGLVDVGTIETVAVVSMSPQTAKDLLLLLEDNIQRHEKEFGTITTSYTRRRGAAK